MFQVEIFIADEHDDLKRQINEFFRERKCLERPDFLQLATDGEANYAVLAAWEE